MCVCSKLVENKLRDAIFFCDNFMDRPSRVQQRSVRLACGEESGDSREKVGQGAGWLPRVWELKWSKIWIPCGMQLDVNVLRLRGGGHR